MKPFALVIAGLILAQACPVSADFVVVPNALETVEGESYDIFPFGNFWGEPSARFQQVFDASQFADYLATGAFIIQVAFRPEGDGGWGFNFQFQDFVLSLSTTQKKPGQLSTNFSENVGPDEKIVWSGIIQTVCSWPDGRPSGFFLSIPFSYRPFFYQPALGNLLVDIRISTFLNAAETGLLDFTFQSHDAISFCYSTNVSNGWGRAQLGGLVTQFMTFPPPRLALSQTETNLVFEWFELPQGYMLEMTTNLSTTGNTVWQQIGQPSRTNFNVRMTLPLATNAPATFYRLRYAP